jgi:hypothetical protein
MDPLYDLHSWSKHYREETLREVQKRHLQQDGDRHAWLTGTLDLGASEKR